MAKPRSATPASTETGTAKSANKGRVRFIFEPDRQSPNGITFSWLIHTTYSGKEKAATATRAFWLPFAYQDTGNYSEAELKEVAQQSIWRLEEQIQHLREAFGVEPSLRSAIASTPFQQPIPEPEIAPETSRIGATSGSLPELESPQTSVLRTLTVAGDAGMLEEFGDAV